MREKLNKVLETINTVKKKYGLALAAVGFGAVLEDIAALLTEIVNALENKP